MEEGSLAMMRLNDSVIDVEIEFVHEVRAYQTVRKPRGWALIVLLEKQN